MIFADASPMPGQPATGRHRPGRLSPLGIEVHHLIARVGYRFAPTHRHGSDQ